MGGGGGGPSLSFFLGVFFSSGWGVHSGEAGDGDVADGLETGGDGGG